MAPTPFNGNCSWHWHPLQLDKATREHLYGYYAQILVDVDLFGELPASIMVERENYGFPVEIVYENLPSKCGHYGFISHDAFQCHQLQKHNQTLGRSLSRAPTRRECHPMNRVNDATKAIGTTQQNIDGGPMIPAASNGISALPRPEYWPFNSIIEASDIHAAAIGFISHEMRFWRIVQHQELIL